MSKTYKFRVRPDLSRDMETDSTYISEGMLKLAGKIIEVEEYKGSKYDYYDAEKGGVFRWAWLKEWLIPVCDFEKGETILVRDMYDPEGIWYEHEFIRYIDEFPKSPYLVKDSSGEYGSTYQHAKRKETVELKVNGKIIEVSIETQEKILKALAE